MGKIRLNVDVEQLTKTRVDNIQGYLRGKKSKGEVVDLAVNDYWKRFDSLTSLESSNHVALSTSD